MSGTNNSSSSDVEDHLWAYRVVDKLINDALLMAADAFDEAAAELRSAAEE